MKVNMAQPRPKKQKTITTTKHFVKPLRNEETKSNKKTANFWAKNQNNGLKTLVHPYTLFFEAFQHK